MKPPISPKFGNVDRYIDHPVDIIENSTDCKHFPGSFFFYDSEQTIVYERTRSNIDKVLPLQIDKRNSNHLRLDIVEDEISRNGKNGVNTHYSLFPRIGCTLEDTQVYGNRSEIFSKSRSFRVTPLRLEAIQNFNDGSAVYLPSLTPSKEPFTPPHSAKSLDSQGHPIDLSNFSKTLSLSSPPSLSYSLRSSNPDALQALEKMRRKHNCIRELYNTEWQFAQDMAVVVRIYVCGSASVGLSVREIDTLFTNIFEVLDISLCTVAILEANIPRQILHGEGALGQLDILADKEMRIGHAMCTVLTGYLYQIYEYYIHRNKEQMQLYHKLTQCMNEELCNNEKNNNKNESSEYISQRKSHIDMRELKHWLDRCKLRASKFTTAWALDCLLIKPIQRLGKYPLFLKTILECSSPESEDYQDIERAYKRSKHYLDCVNTRFS